MQKTEAIDYEKAITMVESGHIFTNPQILRLANDHGDTVAHKMADLGRIFTDHEILILANKYGETVAHRVAKKHGKAVVDKASERGFDFTDPQILRLADNDGNTVAHIMAICGYEFTAPEIWKLTNNKGFTVAHAMALSVEEKDKDKDKPCYKFTNPEILKLADNNGVTVAHILAEKGHFTNADLARIVLSEKVNLKDIITLRDNEGTTVAHIMAKKGHDFTNSEILKLADNKGVTVAQILAERGDEFPDPEILKLVTPSKNISEPISEEINNQKTKQKGGYQMIVKPFTDPEPISEKINNQKHQTLIKPIGKEGYIFASPEALRLTNNNSVTEEHNVIIKKRHEYEFVDSLKKDDKKDGKNISKENLGIAQDKTELSEDDLNILGKEIKTLTPEERHQLFTRIMPVLQYIYDENGNLRSKKGEINNDNSNNPTCTKPIFTTTERKTDEQMNLEGTLSRRR